MQDAVPSFVALPAQQTLMGKVLTFWVQFDDINHPDAEVMIGMDATQGQTLAGSTHTPQRAALAYTGGGPDGVVWWMGAGARFVGEPMHQVIDAATKRTMRMVEWFPDATYGGFDGAASPPRACVCLCAWVCAL